MGRVNDVSGISSKDTSGVFRFGSRTEIETRRKIRRLSVAGVACDEADVRALARGGVGTLDRIGRRIGV